jgi:hypothetical protein
MRSVMFRLIFVVAMGCCCTSALAQQEKGDKEVGFSGAAFISNSHPVNGTIDAQGSIGWFLTQNQYLGVTFGPSLSLGGGQTTGSLLYGGEYKLLFGRKNSKVFPFVGGQGGGETTITGNSSGGGTTSATLGFAAPEAGLRIYASQKTSFELSYELPILFGSGLSGASFGQRSSNLIVFGFKHLF